MARILSALTLSLALLALAGVTYLLTADRSPSPSSSPAADLEGVRARLASIERRLDGLLADLAPPPVPAPATAVEAYPGETADGGEGDPSLAGDGESGSPETTVLARLDAIETRLRGLEEDPVERAYSFLSSTDPELRKRGIRGLAAIAKSDPEARSTLRGMLEDDDAGVRTSALEALARVGDRESIPVAVSLLDDTDARVRAQAIQSLTRLEAKEAAADIALSITDENDKVRWHAVDALGKLGHRESAGVLLTALGDENSHIRGEAILSLGEIRATEALPRLQEHYRSVTAEGAPDAGDHRYRLAHSMQQLGDPGPARAEISRLAETALHGEDDRSRGGAVKGLLWLGRDEPTARPIIEQLAQDPNDWIRREARRALGDQAKGR